MGGNKKVKGKKKKNNNNNNRGFGAREKKSQRGRPSLYAHVAGELQYRRGKEENAQNQMKHERSCVYSDGAGAMHKLRRSTGRRGGIQSGRYHPGQVLERGLQTKSAWIIARTAQNGAV